MGLSDKLGASEITIGKNIGKIRANIIMGSQNFNGYKYDELYYNAIGNGWSFPIDKVKIKLIRF